MGMLSRRLAGTRAAALRDDLQRALSDEWAGHYNFWLAARRVRGHRSPGLEALLREKSTAAFARADRLAARLAELGGAPPPKLGALLESATDKPFKLPKDLSDADAVLRAVLDAERTSARTYEGLVERAARDPATRRLAEALLAEALSEEERLEKLLGDAAPGMDGT